MPERHVADEDCTVVEGVCLHCGADHTSRCFFCDARAFHALECPMLVDIYRDVKEPQR